MRITIQKKITGMSIALGIIVGLSGSTVSCKLTGEYLVALSKENAMQIASIAASEIDGSMHSSLKEGDEGTEAYQSILQTITNVKQHSDLEYIYTMSLDYNGNLQFVVDADQEEGASIGEGYELLDDMLPALEKGELSCDKEATTDEWGSYYSAYAPIYDENEIVGIVGCDVSTESVEDNLKDLRTIMIFMGFISALICGLGGLFISNAISANLKKLKSKVNDIVQKDGNLTEEIKVSSNDELRDIAGEMNVFIAQIRDIVVSIKNVSIEIEKGGNRIESGSTNVSKQISHIAESMETLSASMEEYSASAEVSGESLEKTKENIENIADRVEKYYQQTMQMTKDSLDNVKKILAQKQAVSDEVANMEVRVKDAITESQSIQQISSLADDIVGISNKTRLLALNASIEAARAGEHGKGFAVVAEEINSLSGGINRTATNIQELSHTLIDSVERLAGSASEMNNYINEKIIHDYDGFLENSENYQKSTKEIHETMQYFSQQINDIKGAMESVSVAINEINQTIGSDSTEITRVNGEVSDMKNQMEEQKNMALQNNECAGKLVESISRFRV